MGEQSSEAAHTQQHILDAVSSVIVREGVRGASMRTVAREAEVSVGLLSYHFDDKQSLIVAAFRRATDRLLDASVEAAAGVDDPAERVCAFLRGAYTDEFLSGDYLSLRISLWAVSVTDAVIAEVDADYYHRYSASLAELVAAARPGLSPADVAERTTDTIALSNGLWLNWARYGDPTDLERGLRRCEAIALADP